MMEYIFIHGKNAMLSQKEICCIFENQVLFQHHSFSLINTDAYIDQKLLDQLGGTIKVGKVFSEDPLNIIINDSKNKKILFGLSQYGGHEKLSNILLTLKKGLKKSGHNARFLNKNFSNISSAQVRKSRILKKGVDLVRCLVQKKWIWAKTIAVQDIDAYSKRDYEKPFRDMTIGMMPPKLAQMIINFSKPEKETTIYDPFCGTGTIILEASLRGNSIMGSDIKSRVIEGAKKNIQWINSQGTIFQHDATKPFPKEKFPSDFVVVTEGYLGPPLLHSTTPDMQNQIFQNIHAIYDPFFKNVASLLKKGKRLVICFPYFKLREKNVFFPQEFIEKYESFGFIRENKLRSLLYERENQFIGREIVIFLRLS